MKRLTLTLLTVFLIKVSFAQTLTRNYVDTWISATFPGTQIDDKVVYILNGHTVSIDLLSSQFSKYNIQDLTTINYVDSIAVNKLILCKPITGVVILQTKGTQSKKIIKQYLRETKSKYRKPDLVTTADIDPKNGDPVLIINGEQIFHKETYKVVRNIKLNKIIGLNIIDRPVAENIYGENATNGLIIITTY